ncbi:peroxide stress protein YaaA [Microbacterium sp. MEC084]|uniref:YaaA family protein n=1 Tax=Microbacterium sp. MEC084 TaxID=1963027 RepID=UPI00106F9ACF|nr:peroxide stress protein YaaA [Microbacterium sp. MEC084]MCD1268199.1 peroxide stress protein YaaA [Microbacterium sp. MEC084]
MLLPPSETKRAGGSDAPLAYDGLALPVLAPRREAVVASVVALSADPDLAARVLKLSPRQLGEIQVNAALRTAPTMPAVDRYTGVLFDALDAATLGAEARAWLGERALIQTALLGPVGALDAIPSYRLAAGASLPGVPPLRRHWAPAVAEAFGGLRGLVIDLRSEAYAALGPVPAGVASTYVRVVAEGADGTVRALNHFNKKAKGLLTRRLAQTRPALSDVGDLVAWAATEGLVIRPGARAGEVELVGEG